MRCSTFLAIPFLFDCALAAPPYVEVIHRRDKSSVAQTDEFCILGKCLNSSKYSAHKCNFDSKHSPIYTCPPLCTIPSLRQLSQKTVQVIIYWPWVKIACISNLGTTATNCHGSANNPTSSIWTLSYCLAGVMKNMGDLVSALSPILYLPSFISYVNEWNTWTDFPVSLLANILSRLPVEIQEYSAWWGGLMASVDVLYGWLFDLEILWWGFRLMGCVRRLMEVWKEKSLGCRIIWTLDDMRWTGLGLHLMVVWFGSFGRQGLSGISSILGGRDCGFAGFILNILRFSPRTPFWQVCNLTSSNEPENVLLFYQIFHQFIGDWYRRLFVSKFYFV